MSVTVVKLVILLFFMPALARCVRRARSGPYDPLARPAALLPQVAGT
jgi:hypothetical protein